MSQAEVLEEWCAELLAQLELADTQINIEAVLSLAGKAAHTVVRPAAPLTTFIAGYAAGLATGRGQATDAVSMSSAIAAARRIVAGKAVTASDA